MSQMPKAVDEISDLWSIDFMGLFPLSFGYQYILDVVDYISKWVEAKATKYDDAKTTVDFLRSNSLCRYVVPKCIIRDQGIHFGNRVVAQALPIAHIGTAEWRFRTKKSRTC